MTAILKEHTRESTYQAPVIQEIEIHQAWHGHISGLEAQKLLEGEKTPYLYILRKGEFERDYYVSFLDSNLKIVHQPFAITINSEGWDCQNGGNWRNLTTASFDDILHLIMHCGKLEPKPHIPLSCVHDSTKK